MTHIANGPPEGRALETWDSPPFNRWSFSHIREVLPTVAVHRGNGPRSELPEAPEALDKVAFHDGERGTTAGQWLADNYTDGFLLMLNGHVVFERYMGVLTPRHVHLSQSVAKSFVCVAAGILAGQGRVDLDAPVGDFLPELADRPYGTATLRQVMDMQSGIRFVEDYSDPDCDIAYIDRIGGWKPSRPGDPATMIDLMAMLEQECEHGSRWQYRSLETDVAAHCIERATGQRLADLVSELIWNPLGVEEDASFTVDANGYAMGCGGLNATLRDYARFGEMLTRMGHFNGQQIVPSEFVAESRQGRGDLFEGYAKVVLPNGAYRNGFWIEDTATGVLMCRGIFGQLIYSDPGNALTAVRLATWPEATSDARSLGGLKMIHALREALG